jgi:hypothetical protein
MYACIHADGATGSEGATIVHKRQRHAVESGFSPVGRGLATLTTRSVRSVRPWIRP